MSQARGIQPACLVLRAVGVGVAGGGEGLRQSCPSLGNVGKWSPAVVEMAPRRGQAGRRLCVQLLW